MTKKTCPECVIIAGAHLVKIRHGVKGEAEAKHVGLDHNDHGALTAAFSETVGLVEKAMIDLREFGIMEMEWGAGLAHLDNAEIGLAEMEMRRAWIEVLCAHDCFRQVLDRHNIENPTNAEIAKVIGYGNWR